MYLFITNPNARSGLGGKVWKQIEQILKDQGIAYRIEFTKYQRHASQIVREITSDGQEHTIVMLGGDGTVNEILNGIADLSKVTLGYIPIGSSNDFARFFGYGRSPEEALRLILNPGEYAKMDVGVLTYDGGKHRRRFAVSAGMGFDAGVCHQVAVSRLKKILNRIRLGKLSYAGVALLQLLSLKPGRITVCLDDGREQVYEAAYFAAAMNHPYEGGGFQFCPRADPCDRLLDVTVIAGVSKLKVLCLLPLGFQGLHTRFRGVHTFVCKKVVFESGKLLPVHTDGEPILYQNRMQAELEPEQVRIIVG